MYMYVLMNTKCKVLILQLYMPFANRLYNIIYNVIYYLHTMKIKYCNVERNE